MGRGIPDIAARATEFRIFNGDEIEAFGTRHSFVSRYFCLPILKHPVEC